VDVLDAVGATPVVRLDRLAGHSSAELFAKWEGLNPGGSVKDRPARFLVRQARELGLLGPGGVIIESTSGNFGVALAMIGAAAGYRVIIVVDPKVPPAHRRVIEAYGAEVVEVTEPDESGGYFKPRLELANRLAQEIEGAFRPDQHFSLMNAAAHFQETGPEIFAQMDGAIDYLVVAVSTAGQLRGLAEYFRSRACGTKIIGVDAVGSGVFGGPRHAYLQSGIGLAWPPSNLDLGLLDRAYKVRDDDAFSASRLLAQAEGLLAGPSSGAVAFVGMHLAQCVEPGARVLCVLSDTGQRYLETVYDDDWLAEQGLKVCTDLADLRGRAARLEALSRESLAAGVLQAEGFAPSHAPTSTALLNEIARKLMA
jgi:cystathionine beta-synthase/cysteine synthase A